MGRMLFKIVIREFEMSSSSRILFVIDSIIGVLFSTEVGRVFTPVLGFPFEYGVEPAVGIEPVLGALDEVKYLIVAAGACQLGVAFFLFHPFDSGHAIAVDGDVAIFLFQ